MTDNTQIIHTGEIAQGDNTAAYEIKHGWNPRLAVQCDQQWGHFYMSLFETIDSLNNSDQEKDKILNSIVMGDRHWSWFNKAFHYHGDEYEWFFLVANERIEGICIFYHPKESKLEEGNIFYIEYIAAAPWNRDNMIHARIFKGIGAILIKCAMAYAIKSLQLKPGFSLHSLPQAESYYSEVWGMTKIVGEEKNGLVFFELNGSDARIMMGST